MIELTYKDINHWHIQSAMVKIETYGFSSTIVSYRAGRIVTLLRKNLLAASKAAEGLALKYAKLDNKFIPIRRGRDSYEFRTDESEKEYTTKFNELLETKFEIPICKLQVHDLDGAQLTPQELDALLPIIDAPSLDPKNNVLKMVNKDIKPNTDPSAGA